MVFKKYIIFLSSIVLTLALSVSPASADSSSINFESGTYTTGTINGQDGWKALGSAGLGCAIYDHTVAAQSLYPSFDGQSLRMSDAVTSSCFGDQTFAKPLTDAVGETGATAGSFSAGTKQRHFAAQFDIASTVPGSQQSGLRIAVSPDRGDGSRMSYIRFEDGPSGINVFFRDVQGTTNPATFVETQIATGLDRTVTHTIHLTMDMLDGPSNDVVKVSIDNTLVHTGTSWENYYRYDSEASAEQSPRLIKSVMWRSAGTANAGNAGNGFLFDNVSLSSGPIPQFDLHDKTANDNDLTNSPFHNDPTLKAYYKFNSGALTTDSSGVNTLTNEGSVGELVSAKYDGGADLGANNSSKSFRAVSNDLGIAGNGNISISLWVKIVSEPGNGETDVLAQHASTTAADRYFLLNYKNSGGTKQLEVNFAGSTSTHNVTLGTSNWHNITIVRDNSNNKGLLYFDGSLVISNASLGSSVGGVNRFNLGYNEDAGNWSSAYLDDVAVFAKVLTSEEVSKINNSSSDISATVTTNSEIQSSFFNHPNLKAYYKFNNGVLTTDSKGAYTLTNQGTPGELTVGKYGVSADLGASNSTKGFRTVNNNLGIAGNNSFSVSMWVKVQTAPSSGTTQVFAQHASTTTTDRYSLLKYKNVNGTLKLATDFAGTETTYDVDLGTSNWHHIAIIRDNTNSKGMLYLDGALVISNATLGSATGGVNRFNLGYNEDSGDWSSTYLDDVAVFNKSLNPTEVSQIYNSGEDLSSTINTLDTPFVNSTKTAFLNNNYMYASDSTSLSITGSMTIEHWIKFHSVPSSGNKYSLITKWNDSGSNNRSYGLWLYNNGGTMSLQWGHSTDGTDQSANQVTVPWSPSLDVWYHVAAVYDSSTPNVKFYVDGIQQGSTQTVTGTSIFDGNGFLGIGAKAITSPSQFMDGRMDEVRIWSTARTGTQINNNKSNELIGSESGLASYYPFENI